MDFHLVTNAPKGRIDCHPGMGETCSRAATVCAMPGVGFFYTCYEHVNISNRQECLALATVLVTGAGLRFEIVRNDPYDMHYGAHVIPGFSYWADFYSPASTYPVLRVELWGPRDGAPPDLLHALAAMHYNPYATDDDDYAETASPDEQAHYYEMRHRASNFVDIWQAMLAAVQLGSGSVFDLTDFLMTTVRQWA